MKRFKKRLCKTLPVIGAVIVLTSACSKKDDEIILQNTDAFGMNLETAGKGFTEEMSEGAATTQQAVESTAEALGVKYINFYMPDKEYGNRKLTTDFHAKWEKGKDIVSFEVFAANTPIIAGNTFQYVWKDYWNQFENSKNYKIGYYLDFKLNSGIEISKTIRTPKDTEDFFEYLEIYLYDDVHQIPGNWYSHMTESQMTEDSVLTSIKLTAGSKISEVGDSIKVQAFVYQNDSDFDAATGKYTGHTGVSIDVKNAE